MSDAAQLLERHLPYLKYDSHEAFFADAADIFTVDEGMRLRRAGSATDIATAGHGLSLAFLSHPSAIPAPTSCPPAPTRSACPTSATGHAPRRCTRSPPTATSSTVTSSSTTAARRGCSTGTSTTTTTTTCSGR